MVSVCVKYGACNGVDQQFHRYTALVIGGDVIIAFIIPCRSEAMVFLSL